MLAASFAPTTRYTMPSPPRCDRTLSTASDASEPSNDASEGDPEADPRTGDGDDRLLITASDAAFDGSEVICESEPLTKNLM
jgi:hypothetical protein